MTHKRKLPKLLKRSKWYPNRPTLGSFCGNSTLKSTSLVSSDSTDLPYWIHRQIKSILYALIKHLWALPALWQACVAAGQLWSPERARGSWRAAAGPKMYGCHGRGLPGNHADGVGRSAHLQSSHRLLTMGTTKQASIKPRWHRGCATIQRIWAELTGYQYNGCGCSVGLSKATQALAKLVICCILGCGIDVRNSNLAIITHSLRLTALYSVLFIF